MNQYPKRSSVFDACTVRYDAVSMTLRCGARGGGSRNTTTEGKSRSIINGQAFLLIPSALSSQGFLSTVNNFPVSSLDTRFGHASRETWLEKGKAAARFDGY